MSGSRSRRESGETNVCERRCVHGDEAELFRRHHRGLVRSVQAAVRGPRDLAEDGCAFAWVQLLAKQPERDERLFGWLRKVAIREAWRLGRVRSREGALEDLGARAPERDWETLVAGRVPLEDQLAAREALRALTALRPRERRYLELKIGGHSYREIQEICGGRSYTNVNKHLTRARARLRQIESSE